MSLIFSPSSLCPHQRQRASTLPDDDDSDDEHCDCCEDFRVGSLPTSNNHAVDAVDPTRSSPSKFSASSPHLRPHHRSPRHAYLANASSTPPVSPRRQKHLQQQLLPLQPLKSRPSPRRRKLVAAAEQPPRRPAFSLDILKSIYEVEDLETSVLPYLYDHFDAEEFSLWLAEYRYPKDLGVMFQSEGLIRGMFQRLESMASQAFGIVGLFGRSRGAQIQGLWIWKGKELLFETNPLWQVRSPGYFSSVVGVEGRLVDAPSFLGTYVRFVQNARPVFCNAYESV